MNEKEIAKYLANFFKDEAEKITHWWFTENTLFGDLKPAEFYLVRPEKFKVLFQNLIEGNLP